MSGQATVLIVDDVPLNIDVLREDLKNEYRVLAAKNGTDAQRIARQERPDLILLDVVMPGLSGLETCALLKADELTKTIPVIFISTKDSPGDEDQGFHAGGVDYLHKPANPLVVQSRVRTHILLSNQNRNLERLVEERTAEIQLIQHEVVKRLSIASEFKDNDTGAHITRIGRYAEVLARSIGVPESRLAYIRDAAILHDVGKIGIPDVLLHKPGKLDEAEWEIMKTHTTIGAKMLDDLPYDLFRLSAASALTHHEKWDGSGYPQGLAGSNIPLIGRIVAICDVFDALLSPRPYKNAWSLEEALSNLEAGSGSHFDPEVKEKFFSRIDEMVEISRLR